MNTHVFVIIATKTFELVFFLFLRLIVISVVLAMELMGAVVVVVELDSVNSL